MRPRLAPALAVLAVLAAAVAPRVARACECVGGNLVQLPAPDAVGVPVNARVLAGNAVLAYDEEQRPPDLIGPGGPVEVAAARLETTGRAFVHVLTPVEPLQPRTTYEVALQEWQGRWRFTTGDGADEEAPAPPRLREVDASYESENHSSCGETSNVELSVEGGGELVLLDVNGRAQLEGLSGRVSDAVVAGGSLWVGTGGCHTNAQAAPGEPIHVRAASVDLAGNLSAWSEELDTELPLGCACGAASGAEAGAGFLALAAWMARRRRAA